MKFTQQDVTLLEQNNIIPKGTPPPQVQYFLKVCDQAKLNPFLKQIHMIERSTKDYKTNTYIKSVRRKTWKISDVLKVPPQYLMISEVAINAERMLHDFDAKSTIEGIEFTYTEKVTG